ncbi:protein spinster homolog 1 [Bos indicus]|uniref:Protein spinster homolog 1 n=4 Tax=Bos TaxID=9903 RepID=SPNS1_BOVIN|nr:protein spinster homolog 1 [Bos taurus]XP_027382945.1 protein spinster homolog 1 [Bos indicus x Bos taurus]Q08DX7.1 RecName: Full=Protein spinster homolog 1; AltName: Full=BSpin1; AltName: Full=Spns1 [Bos taurus]AAI23523.1 Spinster homolog 1 (Drosophila) [Bos taurus]ABS45039.1 spinster [Bos taurus]DAA15368.1 TPA: protein spinster homolog 1 [Bos taurus]
MSGSDTAPFLSQADDTDDGPAPGTPGLPGSMGNPKSEDPAVPDQEGLQRITGLSSGHSALIVAVLCYINLLNYMDRFTVAGVLPDIEQFFDIGDGSSGLIQTVFISSYMVLAPVFGYLGDRYNRKYLMCGGIAFWSLVTLGSSFIPRERFWLLLLTRGLVGVGEASYSTIAPTLIADLFVADQRSRMLSVFYFAIPVGSGLGYIAGSKVKDVAGDWHWALRVTPGLGVLAVVLLFLVVQEPPRGAVERHSDSPPLNPTSWWADLRALARNPSFILSSLGFTAVAFVTGSLALWAPAFLLRSRVVLGETPPCLPGDSCSSSDSLIFGLITCLTGVLGVGLGVEISRRLRRTNPRADPLVCAAGLLGSAPFLFLALACARGSIVATYIFIFIGETLLSMNWAIVADILLYVVIPTRRSTAEAFQIVLSHLLGDAGSPYLIGSISDRLRRDWPPSFLSEFRALQFSLMLCAFVGALGGAAFLGTAIFIESDRRQAQLHVQGLLPETGPTDDRIVVPQRGRSTRVPVSSVLI